MKYKVVVPFEAKHVPDGELKTGTIVYKCNQYDYGLASDDSYYFREQYVSVTMDPKGDYPSFTVPIRILEKTNV